MKIIGVFVVVAMLSMGSPASATTLTPYDAALMSYLHSAPDQIQDDGFMLKLVYDRTLGDFFDGFCPQGNVDEFAIHGNMPKWRARLTKLSAPDGITTLRFSVDAGVYDFSRRVLPLSSAGGFLISDYATTGQGTCNPPNAYYQALQSVPTTAKFQVEPGIIPSVIALSPEVAQQVVDTARSVDALLTVQIVSTSRDYSDFTSQTRPIMLKIVSGGRVLYWHDFRSAKNANPSHLEGNTPLLAVRQYVFHGSELIAANVSVVNMLQHGNAALAYVSFGESGTALFLKRTAHVWQVVGGSGGSPATAARMVHYGIAEADARALVSGNGNVLVASGSPVVLRP